MKGPSNNADLSDHVVAVVDDDSSARTALSRLLKSEGIETVTFASARDFLDSETAGRLGCAVIDLWMPGINGLELQQEVERKLPYLSVVFISGNSNVCSAVNAMKSGAVDFLEKPVRKEPLLSTIAAAVQRTRARERAYRNLQSLRQRYSTLTHREREVFALVTSGLLNKQAGAALGTAEKTIKVHRAHVMEKMDADSLADLVRMADLLRMGGGSLTSPIVHRSEDVAL